VLLKRWDKEGESAVNAAEKLSQGVFTYFSHTPVATGCPPAWHRNPFSQYEFSRKQHWSEIDEFAAGDIKLVWEPNRFSFIYMLVRAYWRTGDERYAELFWQLVEDWRIHNPPQQGVNWKCGQEISFRVMAWCFGLYGFLESAPTTAERVAMLAQMIAVSGQRIAANLSYALNQNNNHGISEGAGLWTIGLLFPEFRVARMWQDTGRQVLETQGEHLIYNDGAFSQHSVNYHRVMLHDYLWSLRLGEQHEHRLSATLCRQVRKAAEWLYQIQDERSGRVPNFGANDGALVLPLTNCDYLDFRPVLQSAHHATNGTRCYVNGIWDEELLWLCGPDALRTPLAAPARVDLHASDGGYHTLRSPQSFAFVRCGAFRHRPGEADLLHVDLWWRGQNIASDAGTYSYNAPAPWNNSLAHTAHHNTVTVDGLDQMERVNKFLWLPWASGRVRCFKQSLQETLTYWEGEHDGYARLPDPVSCRRGILRVAEEWWVVVDVLRGATQHRYRLHWLFCNYHYRWNEAARSLTLRTPAGRYYMQMATLADNVEVSLVRADHEGPRGWRSPYYYFREPAISVGLQTSARSLLCWTVFGPQPSQIQQTERTLEIHTDRWHAKVRQEAELDEQDPLVANVTLSGALHDRLEVTSCISS
jgi:asparagine synthase (glutamine-hydrolysing)